MTAPLLRFLLALVLLAGLTVPSWATVTVQAMLNPEQVSIGDEVSVTYTTSGGQVDDFQLPGIDGVTVEGSSTSAQIAMNGFSITQKYSHTFLLVANRAGTVIIPALELKDASTGAVVKTRALTLHVVGASSAPVTQAPVTPSVPSNPPDATQSSTPGAGGPVVMPPAGDDADNPQDKADNGGGTGTTIPVPTDPDGQPARVFDIITPQTTTAYVGQSVPLRIESFIRADANAQQDSLPTLIGSDFLMNNLSLRPTIEGVNVGNIEYLRDSWLTAISAPRAGDFSLAATRDTYWSKSAPPMPDDPFGSIFGRRSQLMHKDIVSNKLVMHILPLPEQGKPAGFTGAIGKFQVSGTASPSTVAVGDPVTIRFTVTGTGNFDYVRAPELASSPDWKSYVASSRITYQDESHTQAMKTFEQAIIPQRGGTLHLPAATFSYFDPDTKNYVSVPVTLPEITVTGSAVAPAPAIAGAASAEASPTAPGAGTPAASATAFAPNRLEMGALTTSLQPAYRQPWFWPLQGALLLVIVAGACLGARRPHADSSRDLRAQRSALLRQEEAVMTHAADAGDAAAFFSAARHAVQLRMAEQWHTAPDSLTLPEIARRDPALAETLAPLFHEADDVIYSGATRTGIDLHDWDRRVRTILEPAQT